MEGTLKSIPEISPMADGLMKQVGAGLEFGSSMDIRKSPYNSICHNDFWVNNMMLKWDEAGNPIDMKIVDFQVAHLNSCVLDLIFFLFTSVQKDVLKENVKDFLKLYFDELYSCLKANGCPLESFTFESFMVEVNELAKLELSHVLMMTKILLMDSKKLEQEETVDESVMMNMDLAGPGFLDKVKLVILMFKELGWLMV